MADKLTSIKIKQKNGSYTTQIPVSVSAQNVQWDGSHSLLDILGSVDINVGGKGNVQHQFDDLYQNIDAFTDDINSEMTDFTNSTNQNITNFTNSTNQSIADFTNSTNQNFTDFTNSTNQNFTDFTNTANQNFTDFTNATNQHLSDVLGNISTETKGTVQAQMDKLQNDMNTFHTQMAAEIGTDVSDWLQQNVTPAGSMTMVDNSLTISDAAAGAKATGDAINTINTDLLRILSGLERGEVQLADRKLILGFYPMINGHMGTSPSARMFVYPITNNTTYYVTWSTGTNKFRTAMGNVPANSITEETVIYNYIDNVNTEHENYPVLNDNNYKYLYIYAGTTSSVTVDSVIVTRKVGYDINTYYASDNDMWEG